MINLNGLNTDYYDSGKIRSEFYHLNGCLHRIDGPAYIGRMVLPILNTTQIQ